MAKLHPSAERALTDEQTRIRQTLAQHSELEPEALAREIGLICPFCGNYLVPYRMDVVWLGQNRTTWNWPDSHGCEQEAAALAARAAVEEAEIQVRERQDWQERLKEAGLVGWLKDAGLDTFASRADWPVGAQACKSRVTAYTRALLSNSPGPNWLILYGNLGTGKSHLAAAVIVAALHAGWRKCFFRVWPDYLKRLQFSWARDAQESEANIIDELQSGDLVVIDDLDKRQPSDWARGTLYSVLNHRYNAKLPTILTFNCGPDEVDAKAPGRLALEEYMGRAVLDRVTDPKICFDVIEFTGPSFRSGLTWSVSTQADRSQP